MTGPELKERREALNLTIEDLAEKFAISSNEIELWEKLHLVPHARIVGLALERIEGLRDNAELNAQVDAVFAQASMAIARSDAIVAGTLKLPPTHEQALIAEARKIVEALKMVIANANTLGALPHTVRILMERKKYLEWTIISSLGILG